MDKKTLFYFGNPKAGSTWLGGLMAGISIEMGLKIFYGQYSIPKNFEYLRKNRYDIIISQSSSYEKLIKLDVEYKGVHVIRDPRDVCVSSYFSYKKTHKLGEWNQLAELREKLNKMSFEEGMLEIFSFNQFFFDQLVSWNYEDPNLKEYKYEDIVKAPEKAVIDLCGFLGLNETLKSSMLFNIIGTVNRVFYKQNHLYNRFRIKQNEIPEDRIKAINSKLAFQKLSRGRKRGKENSSSHYRKGISGDWKNYFDDDLKNEFKSRFGNLLIMLGYENDLSW